MICPKCGYQIPEGHLLCEKCGYEIQFVPDFEPEIENSISESLSTIKEDISPNEVKTETDELPSVDEALESNNIIISENAGRKWIAISVLLLVVTLAVIILFSLSGYIRYSADYQIRKANEAIKSENYSSALEYIDKAKNINSENPELILLESDVYLKMEDSEKALDVLKTYLNDKNMDQSMKDRFYEKIVEIYTSVGEYELLSDYLMASDDEVIREKYEEYLSCEPEFSVDTGSYDSIDPIELTAGKGGKIYYTLDGSVPSEYNGQRYVYPIRLESGEYDVKAVYINKYGIASSISSRYYLIDVSKPDAPIVNPNSDSYSEPVKVTVTVPEDCEVYYTLDGTDPDKETALLYTGPFVVPVGHFNLCFVSVSKDGIYSEIVKRSYNIEITSNVSPETGLMSVINTVMQSKSKDASLKYSYTYDSIIEIPGYGYFYKYTEYIDQSSGVKEMSGHLYAVNVLSGLVFELTYDTVGNFGLIPVG